MPQIVRNVAIIALIALAIAVLPAGSNAAEGVLAAIQLAFLAAIAFFVYRIWREQQLTIITMTDLQRAVLYGSLGLIVLLIAGFAELESWGGGGVLLWIALIAASIAAIFVTWRQATTYG